MATNDEKIKQMYNSSLTSQKEQLATEYEKALTDLDQQKQANQKVTDANLRRTAVEAQKAQVNNEEYYAASGLSSGAKAQARLSQENQLQANMTALRTAQQEADASVERQRGLLAKDYESAIRQAQADNDLALAQALYAEAQNAEAKLLAKQEAAANLMAENGDYSRYGALYGLSDEEISQLNGSYSPGGDNGSLSADQVKQLQEAMNANGANLTVNGVYSSNNAAAAGGLSAENAYKVYVEGFSDKNAAEAFLESVGVGAALSDYEIENPASWNVDKRNYEKYGRVVGDNGGYRTNAVAKCATYKDYLTAFVRDVLANYGK